MPSSSSRASSASEELLWQGHDLAEGAPTAAAASAAAVRDHRRIFHDRQIREVITCQHLCAALRNGRDVDSQGRMTTVALAASCGISVAEVMAVIESPDYGESFGMSADDDGFCRVWCLDGHTNGITAEDLPRRPVASTLRPAPRRQLPPKPVQSPWHQPPTVNAGACITIVVDDDDDKPPTAGAASSSAAEPRRVSVADAATAPADPGVFFDDEGSIYAHENPAY